MEDKTWQKNAASQIVLDSIFAALAAVWVTLAIADHIHTIPKFFEVICSLLSFFCFAVSAEGTTTAYDEKDVLKFVYYLFWYNIGVLLIGGAIGFLIYADFEKYFVNFVVSAFPCLPPRWTWILVTVVVFSLLLFRWIYDACWLLFICWPKFNDYLKELKDEREPTLDRPLLMRLIFHHRIKT
jgi:hypothetical protein